MISLKNVNFSYDKRVLSDISVEFAPGRMYSVIGPNGSGKSTLLRLAGRLIQRESGEMKLMGKDYDDYPRKEFSRIVASLPQSRNVPQIRAWELVSHGRFPYLDSSRRLKDEDRRIIAESLKTAGAEELSARNLTELSGGERQKVYLAMLYSQQADYLLFDEPGTYLDVLSNIGVMESMLKLRDEGKCVITVLHDIPSALKYSDGIVVMNKGRIVFSGSADELINGNILEEVFGITAKCVVIDDDREYIIKKVKNE